MFAWPALERRFTRDRRRHDLLFRPRDRPTHTALAAGFLSWVFIVFAIGAADRVFFRLHISYIGMIHFWRIGLWVVPLIVFFLTRSICRTLKKREAHPLRTWQGAIVRRRADGSVEVLASSPDGGEGPPTELPTGTVPGHPDRSTSS